MSKKYSGKEIIRAGEKLIDDGLVNDQEAYAEATDILSFWRFSHEGSLNNAFSKIQVLALKHDKRRFLQKD